MVTMSELAELQCTLEATRAELRIATETLDRERAERKGWQWVAACLNHDRRIALGELHEAREQLAVYTDLDSLP